MVVVAEQPMSGESLSAMGTAPASSADSKFSLGMMQAACSLGAADFLFLNTVMLQILAINYRNSFTQQS